MLAADLPADTFASVRLGVSAGESFPADLYQRFTDRFGIEVLDGIGSTEALHIFLSNRPGRVRPGTTGEVVPGYELRIEDADGQPVPDGEPGSLYVKGDSIASGYWCRSAVSQAGVPRRVAAHRRHLRPRRRRLLHLPGPQRRRAQGGRHVGLARPRSRPGCAPIRTSSRRSWWPCPDSDGLDKPVACVVTRPGAEPKAEES